MKILHRSYLRFLAAAVLSLLFVSQASARKIYPAKGSLSDNGCYLTAGNFAYAPGDTLVLTAAKSPYAYFTLEYIHGTAQNPIVIMNEGGQVTVIGGITLTGCTYIKVSGGGSADQYGIKAESFPESGVGVAIGQRSSNIEVERMYINNKTWGFWCKQEASCADSLQYPNWVMDNISIHDNKITNMGQEGMYLGSTGPNAERPATCPNGTIVYPYTIRLGNVKVYNNIIDHTNRGGIQLASASYGTNEIYNNTVTRSGYEYNTAQGNGIVIGGYTHCYIHDNSVNYTYSTGIFSLGSGLVRIENNKIDNSGVLEGHVADGMASIMLDTRMTTPVENTTFIIKNNTVGSNTDQHIRVYNQFMTYNSNNDICNNVASDGPLAKIYVAAGINWTACGATPNKNPTATAGIDQTITLPTNSVQLRGIGTDVDGTVTGYQWTKISGPSSGLFVSPNTPNTLVTGLTPGNYLFRLTVTDNGYLTGYGEVRVTVNDGTGIISGTRIEAESYSNMSGIQTEPTTDVGGGLAVGYIDNGDWMDYTVSVPTAGVYTVNMRLSSPGVNAKLQIRKPDGTVLSTVNVPYTTNWNIYQTIPTTISLGAGTQTIRVASVYADNWNFNYMDIVGATIPVISNQAPTVNAGTDQTITLPTSSVQLAGTGADPDGSISKYRWSKISGPSSFNISDSTIASPVINTLVAGSYTLRLTVTDNAGATSSDDVVITVNSATSTSNTTTRIEAENYTTMSGVNTESTSDAGGGLDVGYIDNGDWMDYSVNVATAGTYTFNFRVASPGSTGLLQVKKSDGTLLGTVNVPNTGGWQTFQTVTGSFALAAGTQTIRVQSGYATGWNFNWLEVVGGTGSTPTPSVPSGSAVRIEAESFATMSGIQTENTSDAGGGLNVAYIDNGDWMDYSVTAPSAGSYTLSFRVATPGSTAQLQVKKADGTLLTTVGLPNTNGWQTFQTVNSTISLAAGTQTIRVQSTAATSWNFNWMELQGGSVTTPPPTTPASSQRIEAESYATMSGVQNETTSDAGGGQDVGYIDNGDWMDYSVNVPVTGSYQLNVRVASPGSTGQLQVKKADGSLLGTVNVPNTGGWQTFQTASITVNLTAGQQTIRIQSNYATGWNFNWWELVSSSATTSIKSTGLTEVTTTPSALEVFPNPVADRFMLSVDNAYTGQLTVELTDLSGKVQKQFTLNKTATGPLQTYLSIGSLQAGEYILKASMKDWTDTIKLIKQ